jgi:hypothetical protein
MAASKYQHDHYIAKSDTIAAPEAGEFIPTKVKSQQGFVEGKFTQNFEMPILLLRNHCSILLPGPFLTKTPMDAKASKRHAHLVKLVDGHDHKPQLFSFL